MAPPSSLFFFLLLFLAIAADGGTRVHAFAPLVDPSPRTIGKVSTRPPQTVYPSRSRRSSSSSTTTTSTARSMLESVDGWEDLVYNAQSIASSWASAILQDGPSSASTATASLPQWLTALPILYGAGLLTSVSPCVWGLLPLTLGYIAQAAGERADQKTTLPTLAFAAGLAVVFGTMGVTAAQVGGVLGATGADGGGAGGAALHALSLLSNVVVVLMGLQLLDLVRVPLPSWDGVRQRLNPLSSSFVGGAGTGTHQNSSDGNAPILLDGTGQIMTNGSNADKDGAASETSQAGTLLRTFLLGGSSALVASPCSTPVLTSILAYVASAQQETHNAAWGGILLLAYTLGYATPLLVVSATGGQALVNLRRGGGDTNLSQTATTTSWYASIGPWVSPLTGGLLLIYGTNGVLTAWLGDPSLAGLMVLE